MIVFLFGRLLDEALRAAVLGAEVEARTAQLAGYVRCGEIAASAGPELIAAEGAELAGTLVSLEAGARGRLERFAGLAGCCPCDMQVICDGEAVTARLYVPEDASACGEPGWSLQIWRAQFGRATCLAVHELLDLTPRHPVDVLRARFPMALRHAASRLRAAEMPEPANLRGDWQRDAIRPIRETRPYAWFFSVAEDDLQFRRFDGDWSAEVKRAGFAVCDAVTVLPYDPVRDVVLLIEQFRFGPWLRGARNCWSLEPIAGHIDAGESPHDAALREACEEAQITLRQEDLLPVADVYPSPGAVSEFLFQFVALCDLPKSLEGVSGLASETENIRSHILPFDALLSLIESREVQNGPLVLTAFWLATQREQLRRSAQGR